MTKLKDSKMITMRTSKDDREKMARLAKKLDTSKSEAVRIAVNAALKLEFTSGERVPVMDLK